MIQSTTYTVRIKSTPKWIAEWAERKAKQKEQLKKELQQECPPKNTK